MGKSKRIQLSIEEQEVLEHLQVRVLSSTAEISRCDELIVRHHYLHNAKLVGEQLRYVATYDGKWLAVATWSAAAFHIKARDEFIGWDFEQCRRRRSLLANNSRLLVLPECHGPNLISRFMKLMLGRLCADWTDRWGHPIAMVESFVDPQLFQGTAYKVSGWSQLGRTAGWKRDAVDFYEKHDAPKQIWVRELSKKACVKLRAPQLPQEWIAAENEVDPHCKTRAKQIRSLMELLRAEVPEFRRKQALGYPVAGMVCLILMAMATGVRMGPQDLANFADTLSQGQLRALHFRMNPRTKRVRSPKKTTFTRFLSGIDAGIIEGLLLTWQEQLLGPAKSSLVVIDGKKMRHGGVEMVNATSGNGRFLGAVITETKSNEIPAARKVLAELDLSGKTVLADALHTNEQTAKQILYEQGADYLLTVKGNQSTIQKTLKGLFENQAFPPSTHDTNTGQDPRAQQGTNRDPLAGYCGSDSKPSGLSWGSIGGTIANKR